MMRDYQNVRCLRPKIGIELPWSNFMHEASPSLALAESIVFPIMLVIWRKLIGLTTLIRIINEHW